MAELAELAYVFQYRPRGISGESADQLLVAVRSGREGYERSVLSYRAFGGTVVISDRRAGWVPRDHVLAGLPRCYLPHPDVAPVAAGPARRAGGRRVRRRRLFG